MWDLDTIKHMNSKEGYDKIRKRAIALNTGNQPSTAVLVYEGVLSPDNKEKRHCAPLERPGSGSGLVRLASK